MHCTLIYTLSRIKSVLSITFHFYHKSSKRQGNRKLWHILFTILCTFIYYSLKTTFHQPLLHKAVYSLCLLQEYQFPPSQPNPGSQTVPSPLPSPPRLHSASSADNYKQNKPWQIHSYKTISLQTFKYLSDKAIPHQGTKASL